MFFIKIKRKKKMKKNKQIVHVLLCSNAYIMDKLVFLKSE